jgi:hypothetical protein
VSTSTLHAYNIWKNELYYCTFVVIVEFEHGAYLLVNNNIDMELDETGICYSSHDNVKKGRFDKIN